MSTLPQPAELATMRRYFEKPEDELSARVASGPVCLYLETTNRCNLLCTTCPRTYEQLEPEADMSWDLFTSIVSQFSSVKRVVLHGVGEPMLVKDLPERIEYLKRRGIYVLFNTNGTLLTEANGERLLSSGLDELRVSLDAAESSVFQMVRGKDMFDRIVANLTAFRRRQRELGAELPRVSLWSPACARPSASSKPSFAWPIAWTSPRSTSSASSSSTTTPSASPAPRARSSRRPPPPKRTPSAGRKKSPARSASCSTRPELPSPAPASSSAAKTSPGRSAAAPGR